MVKLLGTTAVAVVLALGGPAIAQTQTQPTASPGTTKNVTGSAERSEKKVDRGDRKFMENAAEGGMREVELGKLAQQKAQNPQVKQLAETIVKDHEEANKKLMTLAQTMGLDLTKAIDQDDIKEDVEEFQKLDGAKFDKEYVEDMVEDHREDVKEFEKAAQNAKDPQLKSFAAEVAPKLRHHLQLAEAAQQSLDPQTSRAPAGQTGGTAGSSAAPSGTTGGAVPGPTTGSTGGTAR